VRDSQATALLAKRHGDPEERHMNRPKLCRMRSVMQPLFGAAVVVAMGVHPVPFHAQAGEGTFVAVSSQPANVGDAKITALAYHDSGAYERDLSIVAGQAGKWLARRGPAVTRPALVLDIDETALSNWDVIKLDDFGRPIDGPCTPTLDAPCGWAAWDQLGRDPAIAPTLQVFQLARTLNFAVFFITGRPESQREATERNLVTAGYSGYKKLYMVPDGAHFASAADFKTPIRAEIEQAGYTIVANVGDQPSDLRGGHAEKRFLLPDPFYRVP
jgi:predicted secreted acid phosphatase